MSFELHDINPVPKDWFSPNLEYEGQGRAEFLDPEGVIEGPTRIKFDEFGESSVEMKVEKIEPQCEALLFLSGTKPVRKGRAVTWDIGGSNNPCNKLTVKTSEGRFSAAGNIFYGFRSGAELCLKFYLLRSQFDAADPQFAKYWVLPLSNFLSEFWESHKNLDTHPLRIYPTPTVPDGLSQRDALLAQMKANEKNKLICFEYNGGLGFIEPLPDFEVRRRNLHAGRQRCTITAVMVGDVACKSVNLEELEKWFPYDFLFLLGVASGAEVGSPWLEFRDSQGNLVRRIHVTLGSPCFSKGHSAIREGIHRGTGHLLTRAARSLDYGKPHLNIALRHVVLAGLAGLTLEEKLRNLCVAFDSLCKEYKLGTQNLLSGLDQTHREAVQKVLHTAAQQIDSTAKHAGDPQKLTLRRIAERTRSTPASTERSFGLAVTYLLKRFNLPDADIVNTHLRTRPRADGIATWDALLSYYRGETMHTGYLSGHHTLDDILIIINHLHDLLLRIVFRLVGYGRTYQPPVTRFSTGEPVDWVKPDLPASRLGY